EDRMTRKNQDLSRAELVRQRRMQQTTRRLTQTKKTVYRPETVYLPVMPRPVKQTRTPQGKAPRTTRDKAARNARDKAPRTARPGAKKSRRQHYDIAFSMGRADVRTPGIAIPQFGTRLLSALLCAALIFGLYTLFTSPAFKVNAAEISGNQRLGETEINAALRIVGQPIFEAVPAQIEANLLNDYPDLSSAEVHIAFPNRVIVSVSERTPLIAWYRDGTMAWIDAQGVAFAPRGPGENLISVVANGNPPPLQLDPQNAGAGPAQAAVQKPPFLDPATVQAISTLSAYVPGGAPMVYDTTYGLGWQDARGWQVYFGQNTDDIPMKLNIYQAIVDTLTGQGIRPTLISVEYLESPFYRLE
ncbi:MAG: FtsQ-type POTRA domain-containing protein, partial [Chloroflexi bacterium]|nr:FtsQ-type POTRA domain-containing protein [Chloroflexota bacterium]